MKDGYQGLPKSDKWGCIAAAFIGIPVFLFLLGLDALGDCAPDPDCHKGFFSMVLLPSAIVAAAAFAAIRALLRRRDSDER